MTRYFDTGLLLKLYTEEPESKAIRSFVLSAGEAVPFHTFHRSECASALHLKAFRGECSKAQANRALADIDEDLRSGVLQSVLPEWENVWQRCFDLVRAHSAQTGCRVLDSLHVACAEELGFREFVTSDKRQTALAEISGFTVVNPT